MQLQAVEDMVKDIHVRVDRLQAKVTAIVALATILGSAFGSAIVQLLLGK